MTKTPEQLEAEARELTGTDPLPLDELAEKLISGYFWSAHDDIFYKAICELVAEGGDASDEAAYERTASIWLGAIWERYQDGDSLALLDAVNYCAERSIAMPEWVSSEFIRKYREVTSFRAKTLDDAFGAANPKNTKLAAVRQRHQMSVLVYYGVLTKTIEEASPIDDGLFESVGESLGITMGTTRKYFYWFKNSTDPIIAQIRPKIERTLRALHELPRVFDATKKQRERDPSDN